MSRPQNLSEPRSHAGSARPSDPWLSGASLCPALYRSGSTELDWPEMRCRWDLLYVRVGSRFDRLGRICITCGEVRGR